MVAPADKSRDILSQITVFGKYARHIPEQKRRETWKEIVYRNRDMHIRKFPQLTEEITRVYENFVLPKKVLASMRSFQFAGKPIEINNSRMFNCAYLPIDDWKSFSEVMFLLLGGSGVGYSVQKHHVKKLPEIKIPTKFKRYLVPDSIEGWADAVKMLCKAYFLGEPLPRYDFSDIRPKGSLLITAGGKAPGPEPLKDCLHNMKKIFDRKKTGEKLTPLEGHDMLCYISDAVLSGGIRRSALISLFNIDDEEMLTSKFGNWWELNPQRARANNSAVVVRHKAKEEDFWSLWKKVKASGAGEPGIYWTNDKEIGTNPCAEISLRAFQFCNLTEINASDLESQEDFNERAKAAAFIGTLQASYTDFHYLREEWKETTEKDALLGIGMTGIASGAVLKLNMKQAAEAAVSENERIAKIIGINKAARITTVKPSGTSSLVLGCSSGIHAWHAQYYVRRLRLGKEEALYKYLAKTLPELIEDDFFKPKIQAVLSIPQMAPEGSILRGESAINLLERMSKIRKEWIEPGFKKGSNHHNVSITVSLKDDEWDAVGKWMWKNKENYNAISVLPFDGGNYVQAPFEEIDEKTYKELYKKIKDIDLTKVKEDFDETDLTGELACAGGACEII